MTKRYKCADCKAEYDTIPHYDSSTTPNMALPSPTGTTTLRRTP